MLSCLLDACKLAVDFLLQGQIHWVKVNESVFLYDVNVSRAVENSYGVAVRHSGENGPIHWATCLYDSSRR